MHVEERAHTEMERKGNEHESILTLCQQNTCLLYGYFENT